MIYISIDEMTTASDILYHAIEYNLLPIVMRLTGNKLVCNIYNTMCLYHAIERKHYTIAEWFIYCGVCINTTINGTTLLVLACNKNDIDAVKFLLDHGIDKHTVCSIQKQTVLMIAMYMHNDKLVRLLLDNIEYRYTVDIRGNTLLHYAARTGYMNVVEFALVNAENVYTRNHNGQTALHYASTAAIIRTLLTHSIN